MTMFHSQRSLYAHLRGHLKHETNKKVKKKRWEGVSRCVMPSQQVRLYHGKVAGLNRDRRRWRDREQRTEIRKDSRLGRE